MRSAPNSKIEKFRQRTGYKPTDSTYGNNGIFVIPHPNGILFDCIAPDGGCWEHVSICPHNSIALNSLTARCPTWQEMDYFKQLFWEDNEIVLQYHITDDKKVNAHPFVLHLWKPTNQKVPIPPRIFV